MRCTLVTAFVLSAVAAPLSACSGGGEVPTAPTGSRLAPDSPAPPTPGPNADTPPFRVAVLLSALRAPTADDVSRVFRLANEILLQKTGERMAQTDLVDLGPGSVSTQATAYVNARPTEPPDGILAFSDDSTATAYGGYSLLFDLPPPNENRFPSPVVGSNKGYLAVVNFFHLYARCGYDNSGNRIGETSSGGECRNRSGLTCVNNGRYWMCPDAVNDLYASSDHFTACTVVHEFLHPFGPEGAFDHYGTAQCRARTGMSPAEAQDLARFQQNCGMCPDLYDRFRSR